MIVTLLRIFYVALPILLGVWFVVDNSGFQNAYKQVNSLQGSAGLLKINSGKEKTVGMNVSETLTELLGERADDDTKIFLKRTGTDVDRVVRQIEDNWVWLTSGTVLLLGIVVLLGAQNYK